MWKDALTLVEEKGNVLVPAQLLPVALVVERKQGVQQAVSAGQVAVGQLATATAQQQVVQLGRPHRYWLAHGRNRIALGVRHHSALEARTAEICFRDDKD